MSLQARLESMNNTYQGIIDDLFERQVNQEITEEERFHKAGEAIVEYITGLSEVVGQAAREMDFQPLMQAFMDLHSLSQDSLESLLKVCAEAGIVIHVEER